MFTRKQYSRYVLASALLPLVGCGPAKVEQLVEVKPNETAFVITLEGDTKEQQAKLNSLDYLREAKVASKRITIPQRRHDTGRWPGEYEWIDTVRVITVDRAPVTREWTDDPDTGTSMHKQAIQVESLDSINFGVGATITCSILEENTPVFLYYYAGKALPEIVDTNVRGFCQKGLAREFGKYDLAEGKTKKAECFEQVFQDAKAFFAERGITIDYFGGVKGLTYNNKEIQAAIDRKFVAENDIEVAKKEKLAQDERNKQMVERAKAERDAAEALATAKEALELKTQLEIAKIRAEAMRIAAEKWSGNLPANILPDGSGLLFQLDRLGDQNHK